MQITNDITTYGQGLKNLKIVAINYPSHKNLPNLENMLYFEKGNTSDFINAILKSDNNDHKLIDLDDFSLDSRIKKIINFVARLEGFEPPTL